MVPKASEGRLPRFSRFEYILDLILAVNEAGARGSELSAIQKALLDRKESFEQVKLLAIGKRKSMKKEAANAEELARDCLSFAVKSGLVCVDARSSGRLTITEQGRLLLKDVKKNRLTEILLQRITSLYLSSYRKAASVLFAILQMDGSHVDIPDTRHGGRLNPEQIERMLGVKCDAVSLVSLRLLMDQARLLNWFTISDQAGKPVWRIYATCSLADTNTPNSRDKELSFRFADDLVTLRINQCSIEEFEDAAWSEYMKLTDNYEDIPVYYWQLRSKVCYRLRISDSVFDSTLLATKGSRRFRFTWSSGSMPSGEIKGNLLKNLPPLAEDGYHMVYVSLSRKKV